VTAYPPKLDDLGVSKNQSSKWQRLARMIDDAMFERALARAKERHGELTTAAVLCEIREIVRPAGVVAEPDINVIASELTRDIESASRKEKLNAVVQSRNRLNPTIRAYDRIAELGKGLGYFCRGASQRFHRVSFKREVPSACDPRADGRAARARHYGETKAGV